MILIIINGILATFLAWMYSAVYGLSGYEATLAWIIAYLVCCFATLVGMRMAE